jgi:ferredoxin-NADP reductase/ferredoxin
MTKVASIWSRLGEVASLVATPLLPSHYVGLLRPLSATHTRQARVEAVRDEAPGVKTLVLRPGRGWRGHRAGQHVRVGIAIEGRLVTRTYSISSAPERRGGRIDLTIKAQGRVSNALHAVEVGAFVTLGVPSGEFVLPEALELASSKLASSKLASPRLEAPCAAPRVAEGAAHPVLFVTGGSGITPIAAMLRSLAARAAMPDVVHVHYARTAEDMIFGEELRSLAVDHPGYRLIEIHTSTDRRRFDAARLEAMVPDWQAREAWACGPQSLLDAIGPVYAPFEPQDRSHDPSHVGRELDESHVGRERDDRLGPPGGRSHVGQLVQVGVRPRLHVERFRAALAVLPANATGGRVRFAASTRGAMSETTGTTIDADADATTPLLHVAERAGLVPRHGCRMGICHSCDSTLVSGCVRDLRTGAAIDEPGVRVQICVCAAAGDVELAL